MLVDAAEQGEELLLFFGVEGLEEGSVHGGEWFASLQEQFFSFFGDAEAGRAPVFRIGFFGDDPFSGQAPGDLDAGGVLDEQLLAELFFIGMIEDGDVSDYGEFLGFCKAEGLYDGF